MPTGAIGLTGVTGHLGGKVLERFVAQGTPAVVLARTPSKVVAPAGWDVRACSYDDRSGARTALRGIATLLMVSASETLDRVDQHRTFIDAAIDAGVRHLVYISFYGAAPQATFTLARDHWATEEHLRASDLRHTILRDNLYADFVPLMVQDGALRGPAGDGRAALVAQDDIADVITAVLADPDVHAGATYDLTGPEALSAAELAQIVTEVTGVPTRYEPETVEEAYASRASYGAPAWQVDAWVSTYTAIAMGELEGVSDAVERLAGHSPTAFRDVLRLQLG
jgi:NAD(P)H dehydrogenase (quinone)